MQEIASVRLDLEEVIDKPFRECSLAPPSGPYEMGKEDIVDITSRCASDRKRREHQRFATSWEVQTITKTSS